MSGEVCNRCLLWSEVFCIFNTQAKQVNFLITTFSQFILRYTPRMLWFSYPSSHASCPSAHKIISNYSSLYRQKSGSFSFGSHLNAWVPQPFRHRLHTIHKSQHYMRILPDISLFLFLFSTVQFEIYAYMLTDTVICLAHCSPISSWRKNRYLVQAFCFIRTIAHCHAIE